MDISDIKEQEQKAAIVAVAQFTGPKQGKKKKDLKRNI